MSNKERLVVIGGVAAGMSGASKAKRLNPDLEIVVFEKSGNVSYGACGLPYFIKGDIKNINDLIVRTPAQFAKQGIEAHVQHEVTRINVGNKTVHVTNLKSGETFEIVWDKLLITTGGNAKRPNFPGMDLDGIFTLRTPEDALEISAWIEKEQPRHAVIVGGGYIGLEMTEALKAKGLKISLVELLPHIPPNMDQEISALVLEELKRQEIDVYLNTPLKAFQGKTHVETVVAGENELPAELVILSIGIRPATALLKGTGIAVGSSGAIVVDDHQRTTVENIWAAGDVSEALHLVTGKAAWIPLATTANKQGKVAGENIGGGDARFGGMLGTAVVQVFDLDVARTGLTEKEAQNLGHKVQATMIKSTTRPHYMPGHQAIWVKLLYEQESKRLLGGQMVGGEGVAKRIDILATALHAGWNVNQLADLDLSYAPPFSPVWDPILVAATLAVK
ncbi:CoA-disulfide reductase [Deltaproteobacteria bacterium TL4]